MNLNHCDVTININTDLFDAGWSAGFDDGVRDGREQVELAAYAAGHDDGRGDGYATAKAEPADLEVEV